MADTVGILRVNEAYIKLKAEPGIIYELRDKFTFEVPGARFSPKFKSGFWDGKIVLLNALTGLIYAGLRREVEEFCRVRDYDVEHLSDFGAREYSLLEGQQHVASLKLPFEPYDYQTDTFVHAVRNSRALYVSPTASGKSLMIYMIMTFFRKKTLLLVPTTGLVRQMRGDFAEYGLDVDEAVYCLSEGAAKDTALPCTIATWQSVFNMPKQWFSQFKVVIGDEAHLFAAKSLIGIMEKLDQCSLRFGFTGTLSESKTNRMVLEGLFGSVKEVTTTAKLQEQGRVAGLMIKAIVLNYPDETRKRLNKAAYDAEIDFLISSEARNRFITNLALSLKGNTLVLFTRVKDHGKILLEKIKAGAKDRKVFFIHGGVAGSERDEFRAIVEKEKDAIVVASKGTFSHGVNIKNLNNIIFASPNKGRIKNLQSIGRGLRLSDDGTDCTLYDIADSLEYKSWKNHTLRHFLARVQIYAEESFPYRVYPVSIKE